MGTEGPLLASLGQDVQLRKFYGELNGEGGGSR